MWKRLLLYPRIDFLRVNFDLLNYNYCKRYRKEAFDYDIMWDKFLNFVKKEYVKTKEKQIKENKKATNNRKKRASNIS